MSGLVNAFSAHANRMNTSSGARQGIITAYDPDSYSVKVSLQPTGEETGWIQLASPWVGNGWGLAAGPMIGAVVEVDFDSGLMGAGSAGGQFYNDEDRCPGPPSGEYWLIHKSGSHIKLLNSGAIDMNGAQIQAQADTVTVSATNVSVTASGSASVTAPSISLGASGQSLLSLVTSAFISFFNKHTHENSGSGVPNQKMDSSHATSTVKGG